MNKFKAGEGHGAIMASPGLKSSWHLRSTLVGNESFPALS